MTPESNAGSETEVTSRQHGPDDAFFPEPTGLEWEDDSGAEATQEPAEQETNESPVRYLHPTTPPKAPPTGQPPQQYPSQGQPQGGAPQAAGQQPSTPQGPPPPPHQAPPPYEGQQQPYPGAVSGQPRHAASDQQPALPARRPQGAGELMDAIGSQKAKFERPKGGWRGAAYKATKGRWNPGLSPEERQRRDYIARIQSPVDGPVRHVAVWSQKGGVGKTTTTASLGITTAMNRTDKILGLDVNPDGGSLAVRVPRSTSKNILNLRDALRERPLAPIEFDAYVNKAPHRFDTITMPPGKKPEHPLSGRDYEMISQALSERYPYRIIYVDCGTNLSDPVMDGVLGRASQLVVVTTSLKDEATVTAGGLEALVRDGHEALVRNAITVLVEKSPRDPDTRVQAEINKTAEVIKEYFASMTSQVVSIPYDARIRLGEIVDPDDIALETQMAHLQLTATVVESLSRQSH